MSEPAITPLFRTKRFDVFRVTVVRDESLGMPRDVLMAWHHSDDVPRSVCEVTLFKMNDGRHYIEWIHVCETMRRQGIATEIVGGMEEYGYVLDMEGVTDAGEAFVDSFFKETPNV